MIIKWQFCSGPKKYVLFFAIYTLYKRLINVKKKKEKLTLPLTDVYWHKVSTVTSENKKTLVRWFFECYYPMSARYWI